jgi:hypothetical protein
MNLYEFYEKLTEFFLSEMENLELNGKVTVENSTRHMREDKFDLTFYASVDGLFCEGEQDYSKIKTALEGKGYKVHLNYPVRFIVEKSVPKKEQTFHDDFLDIQEHLNPNPVRKRRKFMQRILKNWAKIKRLTAEKS